MKYILALLFLLPGIFSQSQQGTDSLRIVELIRADYKTMSDWDIEKHLSLITSDYLLIEKGEFLSPEKEKEFYRSMKGRDMQRVDDFEFLKIFHQGDFAYAVYNLRSKITEKGTVKDYHWNESAVLRKINGEWKIALIHSTLVNKK